MIFLRAPHKTAPTAIWVRVLSTEEICLARDVTHLQNFPTAPAHNTHELSLSIVIDCTLSHIGGEEEGQTIITMYAEFRLKDESMQMPPKLEF